MSIKSVMPSNHLILCCSLFLLPSIFPSIRIFPSESALHIRWPKCSSYSFSISPSNEYSGLTSFRIDWFDFLAVHGILKSLLQHHSSKTSILQCSAFFIVQLSHPYMTTGKTVALTIWIFIVKVMSQLFNTLYRFIIAFLPRSRRCWENMKIYHVTMITSTREPWGGCWGDLGAEGHPALARGPQALVLTLVCWRAHCPIRNHLSSSRQ